MKLVSMLHAPALGPAGLTLAFFARTLGGYPHCPSDEHSWALIAAQVAQGVNWPISGPLHFWGVQTLVFHSGLAPAQALALMGMWSVPVLIGLMVLAYALQGLRRPGSLLLVLSCNTYFLMPLLESRPQQWGQVLVLLGAALAWRALKGLTPWWPYALVLVLTASVHILSFAILGALSLLVWMILFAWGQNNLQALARLALCVASGGLIFLIPDGPYAPMLDDLKVNHLQMSLSGLGWAMMLAPAALVTVAALFEITFTAP